jgi:hypothetical protein
MRTKQEIEQRYTLLKAGESLLVNTRLPLRNIDNLWQNLSDIQRTMVNATVLRGVLGIDGEGNATQPMLDEASLRVQLTELTGAIEEAQGCISEGDSKLRFSINLNSLQYAKEELLWVLGD